MFLLDTNVISELRKANSGKADINVVNWANKQSANCLYISSISILEIEMGILQKELKDTKQASILKIWMSTHVLPSFTERILPFDTSVALRCAKLHVPDPKSERDAMIAATALVHGMTLVTRNEKDFRHIKMGLINPWLKT